MFIMSKDLVAVLHDSVSTTDSKNNECGHCIPWEEVASILTLQECPTCHKQVKLISNPPFSKDDVNILVKHGKLEFRLNLPNSVLLQEEEETASSSMDTASGKNWKQWLRKLASLPWTTEKNRPDTSIPSYLAHILELEHLKILHKGKVVSSKATTTKDLLAISKQDEIHASSRGIYKPSLVVMGTRSKDQLQESTTNTTLTTSSLVRMPFQIVYWTFYGSWWLVRSFVQPFVPNSWLSSHHHHDD